MNKTKTARSVNANPGIRVWYRKQIEKLVDTLKDSLAWWIPATYRKGADAILLQLAIDELRDYWTSSFSKSAESLARRFTSRVNRTATNAIKQSFKAAGYNPPATFGFDVDWSKDKTVKNVLNSIRQTQVDLIKSIPQTELDRVSGIVQRGVQDGRDLAYIKEELEKGFDITKRRAKTIAIDQTQKATHAINRERYKKAGITEAIWVHVAGRKTSRQTHIRMHGKRFKLEGADSGLYDSAVGRNVLPAELVNCRCSCRPVLPKNYFDL